MDRRRWCAAGRRVIARLRRPPIACWPSVFPPVDDRDAPVIEELLRLVRCPARAETYSRRFSSRARSAAEVRFVAPSLSKMWVTCFLTVLSET